MANTRGPLNSAAIPEAQPVGGVYNAAPPAPLDGQGCALQLDANGRLLVSSTGGGGGGGLVQIQDSSGNVLNSNGAGALQVAVVSGGGSNASVGVNGAAAPTSSTQAGGSDGVNLQPLQVDGSKNLKTVVNAPLPAGTNVIGHVIVDSGSTTTATGTLTNNNAAPAANNLGVLPALANAAAPSWTEGDQVLASVDLSGHQRVVATGAAAADAAQSGNPVLVAGVDSSGNIQELPVADAGTATPAQVLVIGGNDNTAATNITRKLGVDSGGGVSIGSSVNAMADGTVNSNVLNLFDAVHASGASYVAALGVMPLVFNGTTWDRNRSAGIGNNVAATGLPIGVAYGNVTTAAPAYTNATYSALSLDTTGNLRVTSAASGTLTNNNAAPAANNSGVLPALANAVSPLWTEGRQVLESVDLNGGQRIIGGNIPEVTAAWTSATTINTTLALTVTGYGTVVVTFNNTATPTSGVVTFEVSDASTNWYLVSGATAAGGGSVTTSGLLNGLQNFVFDVSGWVSFRVRLSTAFSGAATVNVGIQASSISTTTNVNTLTKSAAAALTASLGTNQTSVIRFPDNSNVAGPLYVAEAMYGGAFSGAADATRQGFSNSRMPTVFKTVQATASGDTAVWTPGSGNKFRLLRVFVELTDNASLASGAVLTILLRDNVTAMPIAFDVFVPTTAVTTVVGDGLEQELDLGNFGILSAAANNVLNVNLSSALATGNVRIICMGTEE